jgi:hypothetical protein
MYSLVPKSTHFWAEVGLCTRLGCIGMTVNCTKILKQATEVCYTVKLCVHLGYNGIHLL